MMEDKANERGDRSFSWWDVQDGNAKLPVKETSSYDLRKLLFPSKSSSSSNTISSETATKAAKGAFKMMGKAMATVTGDESAVENKGPLVPVVVIKMLDLVAIHEKFEGGPSPATPRKPRPRRAAPRSRPPAPTPARPRATPARPARTPARRPQQAPAATADLMGFGSAPAPAPAARFPTAPASAKPQNETRAQMLKRQQEERMKNKNRVWDDVDQRWVEVETKKPAAHPGGMPAKPKKKEVAVKLDMSNAAGKSAKVQQAMQVRVNEMNATAQKAVQEVKDREALKKKREAEEDAIRVQLEPKIKVWSEEYGKKKQLQALLASLHTILWPGAKWKPISMGDILQPAKVKKFYFKATLVVHPDKTGNLPPDQRFLAKRIFDALTQAKTIWDESQNR